MLKILGSCKSKLGSLLKRCKTFFKIIAGLFIGTSLVSLSPAISTAFIGAHTATTLDVGIYTRTVATVLACWIFVWCMLNFAELAVLWLLLPLNDIYHNWRFEVEDAKKFIALEEV